LAERASTGAAGLGLDLAVLLDAVARQPALEHAGSPLLSVTEPTETATAAAFGHTAVLAGRPDDAAPLAKAGRLFGRLAHLLDAVEDLPADAAAGAWNPLLATDTDLLAARAVADDAALASGSPSTRCAGRTGGWRPAAGPRAGPVDRARLRPRHSPRHSTGRAEARRGGAPPSRPGPRPTRGAFAGCAAAVGLFCSCQMCCSDTFEDPWTREAREGFCRGDTCAIWCDCSEASCDCCDCCSDCDCCDCDC
jgi:hypothetical protein